MTTKRRGRIQFIGLLLVCLAPVLLSYYMYYFVDHRQLPKSNYGHLIEPQRPIPNHLMLTSLQGELTTLKRLQGGKWLMIVISDSSCNAECAKRMFVVRQARILQGIDRTRILPIWLILDQGEPNKSIVSAYGDSHAGFVFYRVNPDQISRWLEHNNEAIQASQLENNIYLVDPLGHLMMKYPAPIDLNRLYKELKKLLKYSQIG